MTEVVKETATVEMENEVVETPTKETKKETVVKKKNIYQKLLEVRKRVPYLQKDSQGHQYQYVGSSGVVGALREELDKQGLILFPKILETKVTTQTVENKDKYGNTKATSTYFTELTMEMVWVDADTEESIGVPFYAQGIDTAGEKGVGKALTYAEKYFLLKQFNIPTDNVDPDAFQDKVNSSTTNYISGEQVDELYGFAKEISELRNISVDGVFTAINVPNLERVIQEHYLQARSSLLNMLEKAKVKTNAAASTPQDQVQQPVQQTTQQQTQLNVQPPVANNGGESFIVNRIEFGKSPTNGQDFAKVFVTSKGTQQEIQAFANTPETLAVVRGLQENTEALLTIQHNNGWNFLMATGSGQHAS